MALAVCDFLAVLYACTIHGGQSLGFFNSKGFWALMVRAAARAVAACAPHPLLPCTTQIPLVVLSWYEVAEQIVTSGYRNFVQSPWNLTRMLSCTLSLSAIVTLAITRPRLASDFEYDTTLAVKHVPAVVVVTARCIDALRLLGCVPHFREMFRAVSDVLPSVFGQMAVIFSVFHVYAWVGMVLWGGTISDASNPWRHTDHNLYYLLNFNSYLESLVTLFVILVQNDWNIVAGGYVKLHGITGACSPGTPPRHPGLSRPLTARPPPPPLPSPPVSQAERRRGCTFVRSTCLGCWWRSTS